MFEWENVVFVVAVKAGPTLTIATTAGVGVEAEARGVTVTTEAEVTPGGPGGSLNVRALPAPLGTWFVRGQTSRRESAVCSGQELSLLEFQQCTGSH